MVSVRITELYDLNTVMNKMGLIAIHTPGYNLIQRMYPGLLMNYNKMRAVKCDVAVACASMLPADPLQVGTSTGDIAPQDLFNPILYRAVTNDSFNTIVNRAYNMADVLGAGNGSVDSPLVNGNDAWADTTSGLANSTDVYYSLLGEDGWRKAMPQTGFSMNGLVPFVYELLSTFGNVNSTGIVSNPSYGTVVNPDGSTSDKSGLAITFKGKAHPMPAVPTTIGTNSVDVPTADYDVPKITQPGIPKTFVAVIVTPPSKLHVLYYRLRVTWTIEFTDVISMVEKATRGTLINTGYHLHYDQTDSASKFLGPVADLQNSSDFVDTNDASIQKIMES